MKDVVHKRHEPRRADNNDALEESYAFLEVMNQRDEFAPTKHGHAKGKDWQRGPDDGVDAIQLIVPFLRQVSDQRDHQRGANARGQGQQETHPIENGVPVNGEHDADADGHHTDPIKNRITLFEDKHREDRGEHDVQGPYNLVQRHRDV